MPGSGQFPVYILNEDFIMKYIIGNVTGIWQSRSFFDLINKDV